MPETPNLFLSIGKPVKDEYSRVIGKIASFAVTPSGKFDSVFIELGDGKFSKQSVEHIKFDGDEVTLISRIKAEAGAFCDQIPLLWRKDQALKDLSEKKKISKDLYVELHSSFDGALSQLKAEAQDLNDDIEQEIEECNEEIRSLNYALVHLEIEHEIGKMDGKTYDTAFAMIQDNLKRINLEKTDLELTKGKLSNILLGEASKMGETMKAKVEPLKTPASAPTTPNLPEPPVVVYVKEIGKAGI